MSGNGRLNGWPELELRDLVYAYRKAKADSFFERTFCIAQKFVAYESGLAERLTTLLVDLRQGSIAGHLRDALGQPVLVPKKLTTTERSRGCKSHGFFSDPRTAFEYLVKTNDLTPEFRVVGDFPVEMHVLSALWINKVGHLFDACLGPSVYGARLRRFRPEPAAPKGHVGEYHLDAIDSFQPYFTPYKKWRADGFEAMKGELDRDRSIVAVSLDLKSYYHNIDPSFITSAEFQLSLGVELNDWEKSFTSDFASAMCDWGALAAAKIASLGNVEWPDSPVKGGIPIGLSASRLIANVLLNQLDRHTQQELVPVYYGRYVDDIFMVLRDPGIIKSPNALMQFIAKRVRALKPDGKGNYQLELGRGYQGDSRLVLQGSKHKVFFLSGRGGADFLNAIEQEIVSVSSERRLMPDVNALDKTAAARVLTAAGSPSDEADSLRRADGLSLRRLGWSILLRSVETLAHDLRPQDWKDQRQSFYEFAKNHVLPATKVLDHIDYLPRLLSLAVALQDWADARELVRLSFESLTSIEGAVSASKRHSIRVNGYLVQGTGAGLWREVQEHVRRVCADSVLRAWRMRHMKFVELTDSAKEVCRSLNLPTEDAEIALIARSLREHDWSKVAYKDHIRDYTESYRTVEAGEGVLLAEYRKRDDLLKFLELSARELPETSTRNRLRGRARLATQPESVMPFLFPTRPYSAQEIALLVPECVDGVGTTAARLWAKLVQAVRGVWVWPHLLTEEPNGGTDDDGSPPDAPPPLAPWRQIGRSKSHEPVRLGITSLYTSDLTWKCAANGTPDLSADRYERIEKIVKQAVTTRPRPTHLILPELAMPKRWLGTVSSRLRDAGISLIAGLDYTKNGTKIFSEAVLVLTDDRLGYPSTIQLRQRKSQPAPREDKELTELFGYTWECDSGTKPIYEHHGFCFGVLVCSELQNMAHRQSFQGNVDAVFVISWNKDLDTFSALVESAALDVHACIALANNRMYGDSRARVPAKQPYQRDLCRVRGGQNDYLVVVEFNYKSLREFQSRFKNWGRDGDLYKPMPEGYGIHPRRRMSP